MLLYLLFPKLLHFILEWANHGFYEMFYILDGECSIVFEDKVVELKKGDMHVIEPEKKHITQAKYADIFIVCNPPFDIKNVEFCEMNS